MLLVDMTHACRWLAIRTRPARMSSKLVIPMLASAMGAVGMCIVSRRVRREDHEVYVVQTEGVQTQTEVAFVRHRTFTFLGCGPAGMRLARIEGSPLHEMEHA